MKPTLEFDLKGHVRNYLLYVFPDGKYMHIRVAHQRVTYVLGLYKNLPNKSRC